jgi:hypothetical protein
MDFATPVTIAANTPYVVSYHAPNGNYAYNSGYFGQAFENYPLTALADTTGSANGLYSYGASAFPTGSYGNDDYWVGPLFTPSVSAAASPSPSASAGAGGSAETQSAKQGKPVSKPSPSGSENILD